MTPTKGFRFYHTRVLDIQKFDGKSPQLFEVTKIARGIVYYRAVYDLDGRETKGAPACCPCEDFRRYVKEAA
jgi:hypothetical protein